MKVVATYIVLHDEVLKSLFECHWNGALYWYISLDATSCEVSEITAEEADRLLKERREFLKVNKV